MLTNKPKPRRRTMHVRKGDKVVVCCGQYKSSEPREVLKVDAETGTVIVQGVNLRWKHQRRSQQNPKGGRIQVEQPMPSSKVLLFSPKAGKGTRVRIAVVNGKKCRIGVKCGTQFD